MQVSIIPKDKTIVVDGMALVFDFAVWSKKIHAIQWNGASGTIEYTEGAAQWFDNFAMIEDIVQAYFDEKKRIDDLAAQALEAGALNG